MTNSTDIVEEARSYLGTPFHHLGRKKGAGVDCIGLVAGVAQHLNITYHDLAVYSRMPDGVTLIREFDKCLTRIPAEEVRAGDIAVFWIRHDHKPCHAGIFSPLGIIHTYSDIGMVTEHGLDLWWKKRVHTVYRYPSIEVIDEKVAGWPPSRLVY